MNKVIETFQILFIGLMFLFIDILDELSDLKRDKDDFKETGVRGI